MTARPIQRPKEAFFPIGSLFLGWHRLAGIPLLQITDALEFGTLLRTANGSLLVEAPR